MQCAFIKYIYNKSLDGDVYAKDIESDFEMRRASVTGILQLMEKNNLIKRDECVDQRLKKITLTKKALKIKDDIQKEIVEIENKLKSNISKENLEIFEYVVEQMIRNL